MALKISNAPRLVDVAATKLRLSQCQRSRPGDFWASYVN